MLSNYVVNPNDLAVIESESGNHVNLDEILNPIGHPTKLVDLKFCRFGREIV
jgi:hemolysin-activating ACP:hemolysin acyltransferase